MDQKKPKSNVTQNIIHKIHLSLANVKTGQEILDFLKETEPIFMSEVSRFVQSEIYRLKYAIPETQALYLGSVIGAAYIAGFLIAREAAHKTYNGLINFESPVEKVLGNNDIDKLIDKYRDQGKSFGEIGELIRKELKLDTKTPQRIKTKKSKKSSSKKRFKLRDLDL